MCFPSKKEHHPKERRRKKDGHHYNEQPLPPGVHGGQPGGPDDSGKEREEDPTVAEAPDHMPECDLEPFSWRRQHFTADQLMRNVDRTMYPTHPTHRTMNHTTPKLLPEFELKNKQKAIELLVEVLHAIANWAINCERISYETERNARCEETKDITTVTNNNAVY
uniref:Uncharacterized protein n=1 Tax=Pristionchus pacificus TaxID=54126 RepID=A0A8R1YXS6_PRIPA